jgi:thioredoxin 1
MNADITQHIEIGETNFESEVLKAKQPVIVAFSAPWSRPCHIIRSVVDEVATARAGRVKVLRVNVDDHPDLGLLYDIQSIPTLLCFVSGKVCVRIVGTASKEAILSKLEPFLTSA